MIWLVHHYMKKKLPRHLQLAVTFKCSLSAHTLYKVRITWQGTTQLPTNNYCGSHLNNTTISFCSHTAEMSFISQFYWSNFTSALLKEFFFLSSPNFFFLQIEAVYDANQTESSNYPCTWLISKLCHSRQGGQTEWIKQLNSVSVIKLLYVDLYRKDYTRTLPRANWQSYFYGIPIWFSFQIFLTPKSFYSEKKSFVRARRRVLVSAIK